MSAKDLVHSTAPAEIEAHPRQDLELVLTPDMVTRLVKQAELRQDFFNRLLVVALKGTRPDGWMNFGGNPWPRTPEAERLRRDFGISLTHPRFEIEEGVDERGPWFAYTCTALFSSDVFGTMEISGHAGSRDQFFAKEHDVWKPASEVDRPSIKQAAYSNMLQNGVTRLLGLRGLTWPELTDLSGGQVTIEKAGKVEFRRRGQPAQTDGQTDQAGTEGAKPTHVTELDTLLASLDVDEAAKRSLLKSATAFKDFKGYETLAGVRSSRKSETVAEIATGKLRKLIAEGGIKTKAAAPRPDAADAAASPTPAPAQQVSIGDARATPPPAAAAAPGQLPLDGGTTGE